MTNEPFMKKEREPLTRKQSILAWVGVALGILALSVTAFFVAKAVTAPEPVIVEEEDRLIEDDFSTEYEKMLSKLTQPGDKIQEGKKAKATVGVDFDSNYPLEGEVELDSIREVDPMNIGPLKLEAPLLGEYDARIWYITAKVTVDKKPSDKTGIYFPVAISNDKTPGDDTKGMVFSKTNPDCMWGPETWGEVEGNTAEMCRVFVTFDNEPVESALLVFLGMDYQDFPEYAENPPLFSFTAETISG